MKLAKVLNDTFNSDRGAVILMASALAIMPPLASYFNKVAIESCTAIEGCDVTRVNGGRATEHGYTSGHNNSHETFKKVWSMLDPLKYYVPY